MQPRTATPRTELTPDQVDALIRDAPAVTIGRGCELLDGDLNVVEDISADLAGGSVSRSGYATLHGSAKLSISRELDWGSSIVRPYFTMADPTTTTAARFNLGAYFTSTPTREVGEDPITYDVTGYDILKALDDKVGTSYAIDTGESYLSTVETILLNRGITRYFVDHSSTDKVLPTPRVWTLEQDATWLTIINDLLGSIGYMGAYSDWDGLVRVAPYQPPAARSAEWVYDTLLASSMIAPKREVTRDFFDVPNRWVFRQGNNVDGPAPVEGAGVYTVTNDTQGDTSIMARGRIITRSEALDVADQASLVLAATQLIDADMRLASKVTLATFPNPLHWHFDRVRLEDPRIPTVSEVLSTQWTLPLDGGHQTHEWTSL